MARITRRNARRIRNAYRRMARRRRLSRIRTKRYIIALSLTLPQAWGVAGVAPHYVGTVAGHPGCYQIDGRGEYLIACADGWWGP